jgi:hypothetical protein
MISLILLLLFPRKSLNWNPVQESIWLGLIWYTVEGKIRVTQDRIDKILSCLRYICSNLQTTRVIPVESLASVIGQLISTQAVLGKSVRLRTRYAYDCVLDRLDGIYFDKILVSEYKLFKRSNKANLFIALVQ